MSSMFPTLIVLAQGILAYMIGLVLHCLVKLMIWLFFISNGKWNRCHCDNAGRVRKNVVWKLMFVFSAGQPGRLSRGTFVRRSGRRIRTSYTHDQLTKLEEVCSKQRYMTGTEKMLLASALRKSGSRTGERGGGRPFGTLPVYLRATLTVKHRARRRMSWFPWTMTSHGCIFYLKLYY